MGIIRAFIALDLSPEVLGRLEYLAGQLKGRLSGAQVRWVSVQNIHLTIKFLGDVSVNNLGVLNKMVENEANQQVEFEIRVAGLGAFPSTSRPRVIWVGVEAPGNLSALQRNIDTETAKLGYASEGRDYSPHLTLGRVARNVSDGELRRISEALVSLKASQLGACLIQAVHIYRSDLNPQGSVYTKLFSADLQRST